MDENRHRNPETPFAGFGFPLPWLHNLPSVRGVTRSLLCPWSLTLLLKPSD